MVWWWVSLLGCGPQGPACGAPALPTVAPGPGGGGNVLIVLFDDVGVDQLARYGETGRPQAPTPTIDCLCDRGLRFTHAWSTPLCSPTRAALLTGRGADKTGLAANVRRDERLAPEEVTLGELAQGYGWHTGYLGKWHLAGWESPNGRTAPLDQGFGTFAGTQGNLNEGADPEPLVGDGSGFTGYWYNDGGDVRWRRTYATTAQIDDAIAFVDAAGRDPWVLVLAMYAAHGPPHHPPAGLLSEALPPGASDPEQYRAALEAGDAELGRLLRGIDPQVLADTTIVVVGDNGTNEHGVSPPDDPDRAKGSLYEGGVHVPLIVTGPHVAGPGASDALVHVVDLLPTVVELLAGDLADLTPLDLDGVSLVPALSDPTWPGPDRVATVHGRDDGLHRAVRDRRFKLVRHPTGRDQLYDLDADPGERDDLLGQPLDPAAAAALAGLDAALVDPANIPRFDSASLSE